MHSCTRTMRKVITMNRDKNNINILKSFLHLFKSLCYFAIIIKRNKECLVQKRKTKKNYECKKNKLQFTLRVIN